MWMRPVLLQIMGVTHTLLNVNQCLKTHVKNVSKSTLHAIFKKCYFQGMYMLTTQLSV